MADQGNTASDDSTGDRREMTDWHGGVSGGQPPQLAQDVKSSQHGTAATDEALPFGQGRLHLVLLLVFGHVPFFSGFLFFFFFSVTETVAEQECCLCTADDWHVRHNVSLELSCMQMHIHAAHPCPCCTSHAPLPALFVSPWRHHWSLMDTVSARAYTCVQSTVLSTELVPYWHAKAIVVHTVAGILVLRAHSYTQTTVLAY